MANKHSKHLTLKSDPSLRVFTIVISKKVARLAVARNKLRRRIKEVIRHEHARSEDACCGSGVVYTRKGAAELSFGELAAEVKEIMSPVN